MCIQKSVLLAFLFWGVLARHSLTHFVIGWNLLKTTKLGETIMDPPKLVQNSKNNWTDQISTKKWPNWNQASSITFALILSWNLGQLDLLWAEIWPISITFSCSDFRSKVIKLAQFQPYQPKCNVKQAKGPKPGIMWVEYLQFQEACQ